MTTTSQIKAETYRLVASNGRHIRMATKLIYPDGSVVKFLDKMPKGEAIKTAAMWKERGIVS